MRRLLAVFVLTLLPLTALAAEEGHKPAGGGEAAKGGKPGTNVPMDFLMAPLSGPGGKLVGYAYITSRLTVVSESFAVTVRDKLPFIQDAFVRDVNARTVAVPGNGQQVDIAGLESRLMADAVKVMGPGKIKMITVCTVNISELRPTTTPSPEPADAHHDADAHGNPLKSRCEAEKAA